MKKINFLIISFLSFLLFSCSGLNDAGKVLKNEKIKTTDEFLVKKRQPLVLPPNFDKIPEPGSISKNKLSEKDKVKKLLNSSNVEVFNKGKPSSAETSILNKIRK
ncbi:DUF3035 domain-containing protein [Pelagibacteraceae bacterium]|nr:DUF3035 domain-containing protein [Pelagibacteraceae bacterium]